MLVNITEQNKAKKQLPNFLTTSTIFFGRRGAGKTLFMKIVNEYHKMDKERFLKAKKAREERKLPPFPQDHCCFSNLPDNSNYFGGNDKKSYSYDPFKWMLPNENWEYEQIVEHGVYSQTEGQTVYNSYKYQEVPLPVTSAHENTRAMDIIYNIDVQRPVRIHPTIREIYINFCRPVEILQEICKKTGIVLKTILKVIQFESWTDAEQFVKDYGENEDKMLSHPKLETYEVNFDGFKIYDSFANKEIFYKSSTDESKNIKKKYGDIWTFEERKKAPNSLLSTWKKIEGG